MKKSILKAFFLVSMFCVIAACSKSNKTSFTINGTVSDEITDTAYFVYIGDTIYNIDVKNTAPVDTIIVKDKKFSYTSDIKEPRLIWLQAIFKSGEVCGAYVDFILVPGERADLKVCNGYYELDGSPFYHQWHGINEKVTNMQKKYRAKADSLRALDNLTPDVIEAFNKESDSAMTDIKNYVLEHKNEEGVVVFNTMARIVPIDEFIEGLNPEVRNGKFKTLIDIALERAEVSKKAEQALAENLKKTSEGAMFVDFSAEYEGQTQKLSDYVGKGKYVLVDFWASWCGPCRGEIPNLIEVYNKYKGKNFEVLGVATWDSPEDTKGAIEELKIPYPQIMNAQRAGSDAYGIKGIPEIILFAPDGKIIKRGLRGSEIELAVKASLGK